MLAELAHNQEWLANLADLNTQETWKWLANLADLNTQETWNVHGKITGLIERYIPKKKITDNRKPP